MDSAQGSAIGSLLQRACGGDSGARADLFAFYRPRLRRMIVMRLDKRVAVRMDASDIVQDALHAANERLATYFSNPQIAFYPWLRRIAWDRLLKVHRDHIDAGKRSVRKEHPWSLNLNDESVAELAYCMVSSGDSPSRQAMESEMQGRTERALLLLKPDDREILVLRYLEQLEVAEIAEVLGISHTAVTSRHYRALQRLRSLVGNEPGDSSR